MLTQLRPLRGVILGLLFIFVILSFWQTTPRIKAQLGVYTPMKNKPGKVAPEQPVYRPGRLKPAGVPYSRTLVMARTKEEDVSWVDQELPEINKAIYVVDDPTAPLHPPKNKGHEAMIYLSYIIDHYNKLPDIMIFMHAHRDSWHNEEPLDHDAVQHVKRLSSERVTREGYMNLRCNWGPGCPDWVHPRNKEDDAGKQEEAMIEQSWHELFPDAEVPDVLAQPCCAQFAVSRERVLALPKSKYVFYRDWLLRTELSDYISGRVWEYLWQVIFTGNNVHCPEQWMCYCDGYGVCFGGWKGMDEYLGLGFQIEDQQRELQAWNDKAKAIEDAKKANDAKALSELEVPEPGKGEWLENELAKKRLRLTQKKLNAIERGNDPRIRAAELGREYNEEAGY